MSNKVKYIRLIYGIVLSTLLSVTGILLMVACVNVYKIGNRPFTPDNISAAFSSISPAVWITVAAIIIGIIINIIFPADKAKLRAIMDKKTLLMKLECKAALNESEKETLLKARKLHRLLLIIVVAVCLALAIPVILYAFNFGNYTADYDASVKAACLFMLPFIAVIGGICCVFVLIEDSLYEKQIQLVKGAERSGAPAPKKATRTLGARVLLAVRLSVLAIALVFIVAGIINGGMADVLSKAINICTECIGLG